MQGVERHGPPRLIQIKETLRLYMKKPPPDQETAFSGDAGSRTLVQIRETLRLLHAYP